MQKSKQGRLFVVSASSGAGKTSLVHAVLRRLQPEYAIERVVTYTTKEPRAGEGRNGVDYNYVSIVDFEAKIAQGFFVEWSQAYGHYYGSPKDMLRAVERGESRIVVLDRNGACRIMQQVSDAQLIWIYTKDTAVLRERLIARGADSEEQIERRLLLAEVEMKEEERENLFSCKILNNSFERAVCEVEGVIRNAINEA